MIFRYQFLSIDYPGPETVIEDSFLYREVSGSETDWFTIHLSFWLLFVTGGFQSSLFRLESSPDSCRSFMELVCCLF